MAQLLVLVLLVYASDHIPLLPYSAPGGAEFPWLLDPAVTNRRFQPVTQKLCSTSHLVAVLEVADLRQADYEGQTIAEAN